MKRSKGSVRSVVVGSARQEELLDALEEVFQKEGFRRITVGELAARLRCSRKTLYELAPRKEDLFLRVVERLLERIHRMGQEALTEIKDPGDRLEAYLRPGITGTLHASTVFFADIDSLPSAKRRLEEHQAERARGVEEIIGDGVRRGFFRKVDPYLVSEASRVVARRIKEPEFLMTANLSIGDAFAQWVELLRHGVFRPGEKADRHAASRPKGKRA